MKNLRAAIKNGQSRDTGNTKKNVRAAIKNGQSRDTGNTG